MNQGRPISINELVEHTYEDFDNDSGIIARHIANIRKKIGADIVQTEANRGYYVPLETK
jgi:DNA-binding response OmpR family regulator